MKSIPRIEGSPAILNKRAADRELWVVLKKIQTMLSEDDPRYTYYLTWCAESASNAVGTHVGPNSIKTLNNRLKELDPQYEEKDVELIKQIKENQQLNIEEYRFVILYVLCKVYLEVGETRNAANLLEEYRSEFADHALYNILRGEVLVQQDSQQSIDEAFESVWSALEKQPNWGEINKGVALVITESLERNYTYKGYNTNIPDDFNSLLNTAQKSVLPKRCE